MELYIYYRIGEGDAAAFAAELDELVPVLAARFPGLHSRWLQRPQSRDGMLTIMEIHRHPDGLGEALVTDILTVLSPWPSVRAGPRHVEVFTVLTADNDMTVPPCHDVHRPPRD